MVCWVIVQYTMHSALAETCTCSSNQLPVLYIQWRRQNLVQGAHIKEKII